MPYASGGQLPTMEEAEDNHSFQCDRRDSVNYDQAVELLETTHEFPCEYWFKAVGKVDDGFIARVVATVKAELFLNEEPAHHLRYTRGRRHVSVTVRAQVASPAEVLAVYSRLREVDGLVMLL